MLAGARAFHRPQRRKISLFARGRPGPAHRGGPGAPLLPGPVGLLVQPNYVSTGVKFFEV